MQGDELLARARAAGRLPAPPQRRSIRRAARVTRAELAAALGVSPMSVYRWETGGARPRGDNAARYAELLEQLDTALT